MIQQPTINDLSVEQIAFGKLRSFASLMNPNFNHKPEHIKIIAQALEDVERGKIKRLMIWLPPRHGKSMLASEMFPAWYLGRNPNKQVIFATYNQTFASDFGRKVRNHMIDDAYASIFPSTVVSDDSTASHRFHTTQGGVYYAVGAGGSITGRGCSVLIIDDIIKNEKEADSSLVRNNIKEWFNSTAYTRLEPDGAIVIIQTRWHHDDLSGWLLSEKKENWTVINLPAIKTDNEGVEHALWPERYNLERLKEIRNTVKSREWNALFMQTPIQEGGDVFKESWLQYYTEKPRNEDMNIYIIVDPANSKKTTSDNTALLVIGANKDGNVYLLDAWVDKLNLKERENLLFMVHEQYNPQSVYYEKYGLQLDVDYMKQAMEHRNYRFYIQEVGGNQMTKVDRIKRLAPWFEDKKIWLPLFLKKPNYLGREVDLVTYFKDEEYCQFPASRHDDMIDALARIIDINMSFPQKSQFNYYDLYKNI